MRLRHLALQTGIVASTLAVMAVAARAASAAPCYGASCAGKDPITMKCPISATPISRTVTIRNRRYSAQLRWSQQCGAGWLRLQSYLSGSSTSYAAWAWNPGSLGRPIINRDQNIYRTGMVDGTGGKQVCGGVSTYDENRAQFNWTFLGCYRR